MLNHPKNKDQCVNFTWKLNSIVKRLKELTTFQNLYISHHTKMYILCISSIYEQPGGYV